ncbi:Bug family tripartite tricarboxylate transporter substrate binding protein [Chelatococcus reniformis]|uniref:C4-dicarboxylate ABC transporter substrate-binding protein n=1 Tax=Chelatococcus reniformis TaxID=1494448 RepID=A0A916UI09_9HYPH|nr:tripartite tricarboxylate transporter substrate binding protein [Chelatococcus reniformis]GGC73112.1 C4-dicarboxylate ABC transporter substrate-binding protein [Chelatococcus reniformis]
MTGNRKGPNGRRGWLHAGGRVIIASLAAVAAVTTSPAADDHLGPVAIVAPTTPGSSFDQLARAVGSGLSTAGLAADVEVINVPGSGGTVALERFVSPGPTAKPSNTSRFLIVGLPTLAKALQSGKADALAQVVPVAQLTAEPLALVVPALSPITAAADLVRLLKEDSVGVVWAGGTVGGIDHLTAALFAQAIGIEPQQINYVPFLNGTEALAALLRSQAHVGIGAIAEFEGQIASGRLRLIAVTGPERAAGIEVPTLREQGIDLAVTDWRGIVAPPAAAADRLRPIRAVGDLARSEAWAERLRTRRWTPAYLDGDAFAGILKAEQERFAAVLATLGLTMPAITHSSGPSADRQ